MLTKLKLAEFSKTEFYKVIVESLNKKDLSILEKFLRKKRSSVSYQLYLTGIEFLCFFYLYLRQCDFDLCKKAVQCLTDGILFNINDPTFEVCHFPTLPNLPKNKKKLIYAVFYEGFLKHLIIYLIKKNCSQKQYEFISTILREFLFEVIYMAYLAKDLSFYTKKENLFPLLKFLHETTVSYYRQVLDEYAFSTMTSFFFSLGRNTYKRLKPIKEIANLTVEFFVNNAKRSVDFEYTIPLLVAYLGEDFPEVIIQYIQKGKIKPSEAIYKRIFQHIHRYKNETDWEYLFKEDKEKIQNLAKVLNAFIEKDEKLDFKDKEQNGLLHLAVYYDLKDTVLLLLQKGVDVNQKNSLGRTAVFYVRSVSVLDSLYKNGANLLEKDNLGKSPVDVTQNDLIKREILKYTYFFPVIFKNISKKNISKTTTKNHLSK